MSEAGSRETEAWRSGAAVGAAPPAVRAAPLPPAPRSSATGAAVAEKTEFLGAADSSDDGHFVHVVVVSVVVSEVCWVGFLLAVIWWLLL